MKSSWNEGQFPGNYSSSFYIHFTLRGDFSHEVFPLSSLDFSVYFIFGYLTWHCFEDPFFIFTIVMFRGLLELLHTYLGFFFPKVFYFFIIHN
jgi:hypothetical protein